MGANFIPSLNGYTGQGAFRFWCQKVLPLVYDDSLSYYELLNKVVEYLNNVITDVSTMGGNIDSLLTAYEQLQNYVNDYFNNLDVQAEVDAKLDEMAESGYFDTLIDSYFVYKTTLYDKPTLFRKKAFTRLSYDSHVYGQQGCIVTDKYIVLAMNDLTVADSSNLLYVLDKDTYQPPASGFAENPIVLNFNAGTTPTRSHGNSLAWDQDANEIYLYTMQDNYAIVFDADTLAEKRRVILPVAAQIGYDNINKQWCFIAYSDSENYAIKIYDQNRTNLIKTVTGKRIGTTQGCYFNGGLIYLPTSLESTNPLFNGLQNIQVIDTESNAIRSWWFGSGIELEDIGEKDENTLVVATNSGTQVKLFELPIRGENIVSELEAYNLLDLCGTVDMDYIAKTVKTSTAGAWSYYLDEKTKFIVAFGRFDVTPTTYTPQNSVNAEYYSDTVSINTPFQMATYKYSVMLGARKTAMNPSHGANSLGFRILSGNNTIGAVDANIVLVGFIV